MMRLLITGGAGYIGSIISDLALQEGYAVKVVDSLWFKKDTFLPFLSHPNYTFVKGDIRNADLMADVLADVDFIVHTAAVVGEPASKLFPDLTRQVNQDASIELISKAAERSAKGFVFFSTCSNYGISNEKATEQTPLKPMSLYAQTKVGVESYLTNKVKNLDWVICRLSTVYGSSPRMRFDLTVNDFTLSAYQRKYLKIFLPYTYRPYIHVRDAAGVIMEIIRNFKKVKNNVFNVGFNGENYQKIRIAEIIKKILPKTKIELVEGGSDIRDYQIDFSKLQRFLNIKNMFTVESGVNEIIKLLKDGIIKNPQDSCYYNTAPDLAGSERKDMRCVT